MKLTIYRIFSFLLLPIAILFLIACIVIYSFASLNFLIKGIDGNKSVRRSLKDLIKVNAIVSIVFALLMISQCIVFLMNPEMMQDLARQTKQNAGSDFKLSQADFENY